MSRINEMLDRPLARRGVPSFTDTLIEPLARLRSEVERLFDDLPARWPTVRSTLPSGMLVPAVEMTETKKAYKLSVEVPGMDATDIEMHVQDDSVLISGEKKERREEDELGYSYSERSYGAFERRIAIPPGADPKAIKAKVVPAADDEFAKDLGEFTSLDQVRADIRGKLLEQRRRRAERSRGPGFACWACSSSPSPPVSESLPPRPFRVSFNAPPVSVSLPGVPF